MLVDEKRVVKDLKDIAEELRLLKREICQPGKRASKEQGARRSQLTYKADKLYIFRAFLRGKTHRRILDPRLFFYHIYCLKQEYDMYRVPLPKKSLLQRIIAFFLGG